MRWWRTPFGLVSLVALGFALATLVIGAIAYELTHEALEKQLDHRIAAETKSLIDEGDDGLAGIAAAIRRRELASNTGSLGYRLVDASGKTIAGRFDAALPPSPGYVELLPYRHDGRKHVAQSLTTVLPGGYRLLVAADRGVIYEMDRTLLRLFAGAFGAMLLLGIAAAWTVGAVTRSRLAEIDRTALAIIDGDLARRVPFSEGKDEFARVSRTLNRMLDRIAVLMDNLRQVSSDVAHDLRTPLTRLHNRLDEAMVSEDRDVQRAAIAAASEEAEELLDIFAALLRIAEVEGMGSRSQFSEVALSDLVEGIIETYQPAMEVSGYRLSADIAPGVRISGDRRLLQQLLTNLLDNASAHTPTGTQVHVALASHDARTWLVVSDNGPGVDTDENLDLFQRFTRAQRSRSTKGNGLGLALVAAIASAHGGSAHLLPPPGFGVSIEL